MSLSKIGNYMAESQKSNRYYLRYFLTIRRAIDLNQQLYGDSTGKDPKEMKIEHPIRIAGMTEEIQSQSVANYHMMWLLGILHDTKEDFPIQYGELIDDVLVDLLEPEKKQIKNYIDQLSDDETISKGERKRQQINKMDTLDIVPSYIKIFDKHDNCKRFKKNAFGKSKAELVGYFAISYLCYLRAIKKFPEIQKNLPHVVKTFFEDLMKELGSLDVIQKIAADYFSKIE